MTTQQKVVIICTLFEFKYIHVDLIIMLTSLGIPKYYTTNTLIGFLSWWKINKNYNGEISTTGDFKFPLAPILLPRLPDALPARFFF